MYSETDLLELGRLAGAPVVAAERCGWGFENETIAVTLADGGRRIVQRLSAQAGAAQTLQLAAELPARMAAAGIRAPRQLAADPGASPPFAVREFLPGEPGAAHMSTKPGATLVARAMGALLPGLARVSVAGVPLDSTWASPERLAQHGQQLLERCRDLLDLRAADLLRATVAELPGLFADRAAVFAHGDFCPVNVLVEPRPASLDEQPSSPPLKVLGLLDLEFARVADPLFDAAWWGWVVRYHHAERWVVAWPALLAAAGIPNDAATAARIQALQRLRCLEMIARQLHGHTPSVPTSWLERLQTTLGWDQA